MTSTTKCNGARPRIICHMVMSIDGRLKPRRWSDPAAGVDRDELDGHYDEVADTFGADGWVVGRVTMQEFADGEPHPVKPEASVPTPRVTHIGARGGRRIAIAIDPHGRIHYGKDHAAGDHVIAVLGQHVSDDYLGELRQDGVSYVFAGPDGRNLAAALVTIGHQFGVSMLLLEGGGRINGAFLAAGLIDEFSVLVYPGIDGLAGVSSIVEFVGTPDERPAEGLALRHFDTKTLGGGMVWLRYHVEAVARTPDGGPNPTGRPYFISERYS